MFLGVYGGVYVCLYISFFLEGATRTAISRRFWILETVFPRACGSDEDNTTPEEERESKRERERERERKKKKRGRESSET